MKQGEKIIIEPYFNETIPGARVKYDNCSIFIPYWLHVWFEEKFLFPHADKLRKKFGSNKGWYKLTWKITDFFYGLIAGFPLCCVFFYCLRENWNNVVEWEDNYVICRRCIDVRIRRGHP